MTMVPKGCAAVASEAKEVHQAGARATPTSNATVGSASIDEAVAGDAIHKTPPEMLKDFIGRVDGMDADDIERELLQLDFGTAALNTRDMASGAMATATRKFKGGSMGEELQQLRQTGDDFDIAGRTGKLLLKIHSSGTEQHTMYQVLKTYELKRAYRTEWQGLLLDALTVGKLHTKTQSRIDATKCDYMDFGTLVESFGVHYDRARTIKLATIHAAKCVLMKGEFLSQDKLAGIAEYAKIKRGWAELFNESWQIFEKEESPAQSRLPALQGIKVDRSPELPLQVAADVAAKEMLKRRSGEPPATRRKGDAGDGDVEVAAKGGKSRGRGGVDERTAKGGEGTIGKSLPYGKSRKRATTPAQKDDAAELEDTLNLDALFQLAKKLKTKHSPVESKYSHMKDLLATSTDDDA